MKLRIDTQSDNSGSKNRARWPALWHIRSVAGTGDYATRGYSSAGY